MRLEHMSRRTKISYPHCIIDFIRFRDKGRPREMGAGEIRVDLVSSCHCKDCSCLDLERSPLGIASALSASILAGGDEFLVNFGEFIFHVVG